MGPPYPAASAGRRSDYGFRTAGRRGAAVPPQLLEPPRRRLAEFAMPAVVILTGVLVVIAFGLIISRAVNHDDSSAGPVLPPPILATLPAPADQGVIPLPSPSASDPPAPTRSPSAPAATSRPPARKADPNSVSLARSGVPPTVDLSSEGTRDWVHWGQQGTFSLERDKDGNFAILEGAPIAPRFQHDDSPQTFSWSGGSPVDRSDGTPTGIHTCGRGNGFTLSAPAGTGTRRLRLYVGVLAARGKLTATLSTGGGASATTLEDKDNALSTAVITVTYRASKDGKLNMTWVTDAAFGNECGGVALEAATLR